MQSTWNENTGLDTSTIKLYSQHLKVDDELIEFCAQKAQEREKIQQQFKRFTQKIRIVYSIFGLAGFTIMLRALKEDRTDTKIAGLVAGGTLMTLSSNVILESIQSFKDSYRKWSTSPL